MSAPRLKEKTSLWNPGIHRFASAFFQSIKGERLEPIRAEYRMVLELFEAYPDLSYVLNHIVLSDEEKAKILARVLKTCSVSKELSSFLKVLVSRRHMDWLRPIYDSLQVLVHREHNLAVAQVRVAASLTEVQTEKLKEKLEALTQKKIDMKVEEDPSLLGGIVAQVGDRIFDSSLKYRLESMKHKMAFG